MTITRRHVLGSAVNAALLASIGVHHTALAADDAYTFRIADVTLAVTGTYYSLGDTVEDSSDNKAWELKQINSAFTSAFAMLWQPGYPPQGVADWMTTELNDAFDSWESIDQVITDSAIEWLFTYTLNGQPACGYWTYTVGAFGEFGSMARVASYTENFLPDFTLLQKDVTLNGTGLLATVDPATLASRFGLDTAASPTMLEDIPGLTSETTWVSPTDQVTLEWDPAVWGFPFNMPNTVSVGEGWDRIFLSNATDQVGAWFGVTSMTDMSVWEMQFQREAMLNGIMPNPYTLIDSRSDDQKLGMLFDTTNLAGETVVNVLSAAIQPNDTVLTVWFWAPPETVGDRLRDVLAFVTVDGEAPVLGYTPAEVDTALS